MTTVARTPLVSRGARRPHRGPRPPAAALAAMLAPLCLSSPAGADTVDFERDVKPILAGRCFSCHGPDARARKAGLRLDVRDAAIAALASGNRAVVPDDPAASEIVARVEAADPDVRMPPQGRGAPLDAAEQAVLRRWIAGGAPWPAHWAFVAPVRPTLPAVRRVDWPRNAVDRFVLARLEAEGLEPSPEADPRRWIRRASLDLTGLPPEPDDVAAFIADASAEAHARVIDRFLDSKHHGERMAQDWLDLARYADSDGFHQDITRSMWQYRDWVIASFNANKRFDQFTIEQLAGDLLPSPTLAQRVATAFNRNNMTSTEAGADAAEYLSKNVIDRVNTTSTVWLGLTVGCAECHDHKYDPISQNDYYRLYDFFHQVPEKGLDMDPAPPFVKVPSLQEEVERERLESSLRVLSARQARLLAAGPATGVEEEVPSSRAAPAPATLTLGEWQSQGPLAAGSPAADAFDAELPPERGGDGEWKPEPGLKDGAPHRLAAGPGAIYLRRKIALDPAAAAVHEQEIFIGASGALKAWWNGRLVLARSLERRAVLNQERLKVAVRPGENDLLVKVVASSPRQAAFYFATDEETGAPDLKRAREASRKPAGDRTPDENALLDRLAKEARVPELREIAREMADLEQARRELEESVPTLRVMEDLAEPRPTFVLERGDYRNHGERVTAGVPASIAPALAVAGRANRLDLARWIVDRRNPLTARVAVNRLWQMLFGTGIVKTSNDFGTQGEPPSHPELLDWLAVELVDSGWDVKSILRTITTSATYRQSSDAQPQLLARDPENRLVARGPRARLPAEAVRDNALAVSGLLDRTRPPGGPSVRPYQPEGLWEEKGYQKYIPDHGADLYRRSLYTFWKRSVPYPSFMAFDAPDREVCTARRETTCTPLQALVTLNDPTYLEAARALAQRVLREAGPDTPRRVERTFLLALGRPPLEREAASLAGLESELRGKYSREPAAARDLLSHGESPLPRRASLPELAAWTVVASVVLNLDEALTKE